MASASTDDNLTHRLRSLAGRATRVVRRPAPPVVESDDEHPERLAVLPHVHGRCVEIGCGHRKSRADVVGVDLVPGGSPGRVGNVTGKPSQADVAADGGLMPFRDATVDVLVARHNLEHYVDTIATLIEWRRVLVPGGSLVLVMPDEERYDGRTVDLDPTHYHCFTEQSLTSLVELVGGLRVTETRPVIDEWSFLLVATKAG
jgi:SAM-dependent methyltransferase